MLSIKPHYRLLVLVELVVVEVVLEVVVEVLVIVAAAAAVDVGSSYSCLLVLLFPAPPL